jgi:creatinine amidohydrolase
MSFGGTLSVFHQVYAEMVASLCRSCISMGASKIWILNGHGGNRMPLGIVLQQLKNEFADVLVTATEYWNIAREEIMGIRESAFGGLGHACELETSLYLYSNEAGVRLDLIKDDGVQTEGSMFRSDMLVGGPAARVINFDELTASGVFGRPTLASKEKGERLFTAIAAKLTAFAEELHSIGKQGSN